MTKVLLLRLGSLKAMQQISKTGIKRNVVRETTGPDRAAACAQVERNGGFWGPWLSAPISPG